MSKKKKTKKILKPPTTNQKVNYNPNLESDTSSLASNDSMKKWKDMMDSESENEEDPFDHMKKNKIINYIEATSDISELIQLTKHNDQQIKLKAVQALCPCRLKRDFEDVYDRLFELSLDEDPKVRYQVLHNICDGSPQDYEARVMKALENFNRDPDRKIRRAAHKVLGSVLHNGGWNVM